ncbi:LOW QUALITY PROTEIN: hypothetical protein BRADI_5g04800v3 [Brachypodium distachyon]|uniref:CCHC-type domain-containing protein n=1 Tax=Brachypodium distachyon TaxID=15368 RepID=A0A0Q3E6W6_BRADI|nr:LOW QUALITY PROTEIN: hypothetical protein BRADI_5g04800v3 [Brachypodium distachyon]
MDNDALRREDELRCCLERQKDDCIKRDRERERWGSPPSGWKEQERRNTDAAARERAQKGRYHPGGGSRASPVLNHQPKQKQPPPRPPSATKADSSREASAATCFNHGKTGHFQASCPFPASCILCKKDGHAAALCPTKGKKAELSLLGFGIPGHDFYHLELTTSGDDEKASNSALVSVISSQLLEDELKNLFEEEWDWHVKQLSDLEFAVVFPSKESLRFACKSGRLVLPLNQVSVSIKEEEVDAEASSVLSEVWPKLSGIPRKIRDPEILVVACKAIEVDGSSLTRKGPVRMKFQCRNPNKIRGSMEIFIHKIGYKIKVVPEMPMGASKPPPVPPSEDSHGDDSADPTIDEEEWERLGKHDKERKDTAASQKSPLPLDKSGSSGQRTLGTCSAPAQLHSVVIDQYSSNLRGAGDIFPALQLLQAPPLPASALVPGAAPPLSTASMEISDDDQRPIPSTDGSPFELLSLSPLAREKGGPGQRDWDFADIATLSSDHQSPPTVVEVPEVPPTLPRDLREELPRSAPVRRAKRSMATPVVATRKSARNASAAAIPVLQHATLMQAEKNLEVPVHSSAIRAKELAQAAFAEAAACAAAKPETPPEPPAPTSSFPSKPAPPKLKAGRSKKLAARTLALRKGQGVRLRAK